MLRIDLRPDQRKLRQFGFIALAGFGALAVMAWFERLVFAFGLGEARPIAAGVLAGLGLLSALLSLVHPRANRPLYVGLTLLALPVGYLVSYLTMGALFYLLITPLGLFFRIVGRDPLHRRFRREAGSYWIPPGPRPPRERYFRQF